MRYTRQTKIIELISSHNVETQEELARLLHKSGYKATQATVSRDIKELKLVKILGPDGKYKYALNTPSQEPTSEKFTNLLKDVLISASSSGNMVVVKTMSGCAGAACEAIDALRMDKILGTLAGDNTIFIVATEEAHAPILVKFFNELVKGR